MSCNDKESEMSVDYQNDYKKMYEELRALVRLYFEVKNDDSSEYEDDEWEDIIDNTELDICVLVGLIDWDEVNEDASDYP
jgi:hypothetical protein